MKVSFPGINPEISEWKGQEIIDFQEDLLLKVNGRLSEKWFYSHFKTNSESLPRIDVLNLLSQYAGYKNWDDFRYKFTDKIPDPVKPENTNSVFIRIPLILLSTIILLIILFKIINTQTYKFSFIDSDTGEPITNTKIQAELFLQGESPESFVSDSSGNITIRTSQSTIKMAVKAACYLPDTIIRTVKKFNREEKVRLKVDDYASMIQYFSRTDLKSWQKRREQLDKIIGDEAMIYQLPDLKMHTGMELYNKQEFIDLLTMPSSSLSMLEILESKYDHGQIVILKYKINRKK
jgi:hypothetical protein